MNIVIKTIEKIINKLSKLENNCLFFEVHLFVVNPESFFQLLLHLLLVVLNHELGRHLEIQDINSDPCILIQF